MGLRVTTFATIWVLMVCAVASADTIHLKNGRTILADHVRENGSRYEYEVGDDTYAIPKSSVERVEAGGMPASAASSGAAKSVGELPAFIPADSLANEGDLPKTIVKDGKVDPDALAKLESKGNAELSATADFIAGKFEFDQGNIDQARRYFDSALRFQPENSTVLIYYAALLVRTGNPSQALPYAQRAVSAAPDSPDAYTVLGYAQQASDRTKDAVASWKHSLELRPIPPSNNIWKRLSANKMLRPTSLSAKAAILFCTTRASRLPKHSVDKSWPRSNRTTMTWRGI